MREILGLVDRCLASDRRFAVAIVTQTWGSSPRPVGSMMAVSEDGSVAGSVSGGCVEGAVIDAALRAIVRGEGEWICFDRLADGDFWSVGLSCGGKIEVLVTVPCLLEGEAAPWMTAFDLAARNQPFRFAIAPNGARILGELEQEAGYVYEHRRRERLIVIGGVHIAVPLIVFASGLGFETVLIEPRETFADSARFIQPPDTLLTDWPGEALPRLAVDEETFVVLLTHDPKIDDPALEFLLRSPVRYIGCLGSRTTQIQRTERLRTAGFSEEEIGRIHGPVGLSIGAQSPEEIAISIAAELVQVRRGA